MGYHLDGTDYDDTIYGSERADDIFGEGGNDQLFGGGGNDHLYGGYGDDMLHGGAGADQMNGDHGNDTVSYAGSSAVTVNLASGGLGGDAQGDTYFGIENVIGSSFDDVIIGDIFSNRLDGGAGNDVIMAGGGGGADTLVGGAGNDMLIGSVGNDTLIGSAGSDTLTGGQGLDTFVFIHGDGADHITDFQQGADKIDLTGWHEHEHGYHHPVPPMFGYDGELASGWVDQNGLHGAQSLDWSDQVFFDLTTRTLYECDYIESYVDGEIVHTLVLEASILTIDTAGFDRLQTSDFIV